MKKIMKTALVMVAILLAIVLASGCTERSLIETSVNRLEEIKKEGI